MGQGWVERGEGKRVEGKRGKGKWSKGKWSKGKQGKVEEGRSKRPAKIPSFIIFIQTFTIFFPRAAYLN